MSETSAEQSSAAVDYTLTEDTAGATLNPGISDVATAGKQSSLPVQLLPAAAQPPKHEESQQESDANLDDVFDFDPGFQEDPNQPLTESDVDDEDDDVGSINDSFVESERLGSAVAAFSTSVPIDVPLQWCAANAARQQQQRRHDDIGSEEPVGPEDMAASIQALARSVHADSAMVFGELPKSRTRTSRTLSSQSSVSDAAHVVSAQYDGSGMD